MDFSLSAEQRELTEAAAAFARRELNQDLLKREAAGEFPREAWRRCARFGVQGLPVPAGLGGAGSDVVTTALGYECWDNGLLFSLNAQMWSVELPLVTFGTPAQQRAYLPGMVSGDLAVSSSFEKMGLRTWGSSGTCGMRSRALYTRAPRRSSGWYSPGCSGSEPPGQARHPRRASREGNVMAYLLQRLLTEAAARAPQRPAVASEGCLLTYRELDELSNKVARVLLRLGVAPGDRVGILAPKSAAAVIGLYGALKAGACYVPLDPKAPAGRLGHIVADCGAAVIVADEARTSQAAALAGAVPRPPGVVVVGVPGRPGREAAASVPARDAALVPWTAVAGESGEPLAGERAIETDLAYILYTSGSTGTPKGVMISHRNSLTFVEWAAAAAGLGEQDRVCSPAPLHFDLSVFDVFAACAAAACLTVLPDGAATFPVSIARWLEAERVSVWYSVPSVLTLLACYGSLGRFDLSGLRTVIFAGEVFPPRHLARLMAELPHPRYLNWYGPTETNVVTAFEVPAGGAGDRPAPIGKACANTEVFAVTSEGHRVSRPGEEGELYVRGPSLMRGYWGQPAKTSEALVANPFRAESGELVYRTGDLVTLDEAGNYAYLGRRDSMVKIRGYRIELGEVEATLYRHPAIGEAAVLPVPDELLGTRLRAVITADGSGLTREDVLDHCRQWLPGYMVPDIIEFRETLPRTSTGKVDRAGLTAEQHELEPAGDGRQDIR